MGTTRKTNIAGFEEWCGRINQACGCFAAKPLGEGFQGAVRAHRSGALNLSIVDAAQAQLYRGEHEVMRGGTDIYYAGFQLQGSARMQQAGRSVTLMPGDIILIDSTQPSSFIYGGHSRQLSLVLPRHCVEQSLGPADALGGLHISADSPLAVLAARLVLESSRQENMGEKESEAALGALVNLLRPAIRSSEMDFDVHERIYQKAIRYIEQNIRSETLCPGLLAREVGVSVRGLYRIFAGKGMGVGAYIRSRRLDLCAESIRGAGNGQKISSHAYAWGFSDVSHFINAFKGRFGITPGEYRRRHI